MYSTYVRTNSSLLFKRYRNNAYFPDCISGPGLVAFINSSFLLSEMFLLRQGNWGSVWGSKVACLGKDSACAYWMSKSVLGVCDAVLPKIEREAQLNECIHSSNN